MSGESTADIWRRIIIGDGKSWVTFTHGTCVMFTNPNREDDLAARAIEIMQEYGPVHAGSPAGDFGTITLDAVPGWVVYGHHPDMLTYVAPDDVTDPSDLAVGLFGRGKRDTDGRDPQVVHVEDRRSA